MIERLAKKEHQLNVDNPSRKIQIYILLYIFDIYIYKSNNIKKYNEDKLLTCIFISIKFIFYN
jgi:hypothetical protein